MARSLRYLFALLVPCVLSFSLTGCQDSTPAVHPSVTPPPTEAEKAASAEEHDHPDHGPNNGHMMALDDGSEVEVMFADDIDMFSVFPSNPGNVKKVEMITTVDGEETAYEFESQKTFDSTIFALTSPELTTAAKMGDSVDVKLVITREDGTQTGKFVPHSH